jgi:hypothetical protein
VDAVRKRLAGRVTVRTGRPDDLASLVEIERAAGETFRYLGMDLIADDDPGSVEELAPYAEPAEHWSQSMSMIGRSGTCCSTSSTPPPTSSRSACTPTTRGKASAGR